MFFEPFPPNFAKRMDDDVAQFLLTIMVLLYKRRLFRNLHPDKIAPANVDFVARYCSLIQRKAVSKKLPIG